MGLAGSMRRRIGAATATRRARRLIAASGLFDPGWYGEQAGLPAAAATIDHYLAEGEPRGWSPHPLFDVVWYRRQVKGAARSQLGAFAHYLGRGAARGDPPHGIFDRDWYLEQAPDALGHPTGLLGHYLDIGGPAGITPNPWLPGGAATTSGRAGRVTELPAVAVVRRFAELERSAGPSQEADRSATSFDRRTTDRLLAEVVEPFHAARTTTPLVSVVLPTYDRAEPLRQAIASVVAQTYEHWELIVADDGSTDATPAVVAAFADPRIEYLPLERGGVCRARNAGLARARGRYVAYLDSDNAFQPRFLEVMVAFLSSSEHRAAHSALRFSEEGRTLYRTGPFDRAHLLLQNAIDCNTIVHERELAAEIGGWDEELRRTNDWDYVLRLTAVTPLAYVPYVGVDYEHDRRKTDRITIREPVGYRMKVREKHLLDWSRPMPIEPGTVSVVIVAAAPLELLETCVASVLEHAAHPALEIIVVDPGLPRGDGLRVVGLELLDPRVQVHRLVGELHEVIPRNAGALRARGEHVVFLASDLRVGAGWLPPLLAAMSAGAVAAQPLVLDHSGVVVSTGLFFPPHGLPYLAWAGSAEQSPWVEGSARRRALTRHCLVVRGDALRHARGFDPLFLRTLFDADLCLRLTATGGHVSYVADSVVVRQFDRRRRSVRDASPNDRTVFEERWNGRVAADEPAAFEEQGLVPGRRAFAAAPDGSQAATHVPSIEVRQRAAAPLRWAIKIAAREVDVREAWGDWHFAGALRDELQALGHEVVIDLHDAWYRPTAGLDEVVLCLRGVRRYHPDPDQLNLLWVISHPDDVSDAEYGSFDRVFVASEPFARTLADDRGVPAEVLLQCTDPARFRPSPASADGPQVLFVGNSRLIRRPIVRDAIDAGLDLTIVGAKWQGLVADRYLLAEHVPNEHLPALYRSAGVVLNDHWADMRRRGFLSNRLFDLAACGVPVVSDEIEGLEVFGGLVRTYRDPADLAAVVEEALTARDHERADRMDLARIVRERHTFGARAQALAEAAAEARAAQALA
jgi:O-antigen biosynthesis protein